MELELRDILSDLYFKYGNTEEVIKLSKLVDGLVVNKQKICFQNYINSISVN